LAIAFPAYCGITKLQGAQGGKLSCRIKEIDMPAKNSIINVVFEEPLYREVQFLAMNDGVSMSTKVRM
jgi:hypothetical protein